MKRSILLAVVLLAVFGRIHTTTTTAQSCPSESEPNDDPANANVIQSCISATVFAGDQDLFWLDVTSSSQLYPLTLSGIPVGLTRLQIYLPTLNDNGDVTSLQEFGDLSVFNGDTATTPPFAFQPGRYILGISTAGGVGAYQLTVESDAFVGISENEPNDDPASAASIVPGNAVLASIDDGTRDWYRWTVDDPDQLWRIVLRSTINKSTRLDLSDSDRRLITSFDTDEWGALRMLDLQLSVGDYLLSLNNGTVGAPYTLFIGEQEPADRALESEPNDDIAAADLWQMNAPMQGRIITGERYDYYAFIETQEDTQFDLRLTTAARGEYEMCLYDHEQTRLQCRKGIGVIELQDLVLPPCTTSPEPIEGRVPCVDEPTHYVGINSTSPEADSRYTLERIEHAAVGSQVEREPNDDFWSATPVDASGRSSGRLIANEWDYFKLTVSDAVQLWRVQAIGGGITDFRLINGAGRQVQSANISDGRRTRFPNLLLPIGDHYIGVRGTGDYRLLAVPLGEPPAGFEQEPNGETNRANAIALGQSRTGFLNSSNDRDYYAFELATPSTVRLTLTPPGDGIFSLGLGWNGSEIKRLVANERGEALAMTVTLAAGQYTVFGWASGAASADLYTLTVESLGQFSNLTDLEPLNDRVESATEIPVTLIVTGTLPSSDRDHYLLPPLLTPATLTFRNAADVDLRLYDRDNSRLDLESNDDGTLTTVEQLTPDRSYYFFLSGGEQYDIELEFSDGLEAQQPLELLAADVVLTLESDQLAAYWATGQQVGGTLTIDGDLSGAMILTARSNHPALALTVPPIVEAQAGLVTLPVMLNAAGDLPAGRFSVAVQIAQGVAGVVTEAVVVEAELVVSAENRPTNPTQRWPLLNPILGSFNAAASYFGAVPVANEDNLLERQLNLHDGATALSQGFRWNEPVTLTVDLAGDAPIDVIGFALNPQNNQADTTKLNNFELWLSDDGRNFTFVYAGNLTTQDIEQVVTLEAPVAATHAQLRMLDSRLGSNTISLGEWKVFTRQPLVQSANLLDPQLGGYVVDMQPVFNGTHALNLLLPDTSENSVTVQVDEQLNVTLGFQHNRAAQIGRINWLPAATEQDPVDRITVTVSNDNLNGPWQTVGTFAPADGGLQFADPLWARFVRLSYPTVQERTRHTLPQQIEIIERPSDNDYRSIVAEWGHYNRAAVYEWLNPTTMSVVGLSADSDNSLATATALPLATVATGDVLVQQDSDWYAVAVEGDVNAVVFELTGEPTVDTRLRVVDADGNTLPLQTDLVAANRQLVTATIEAGTSTVYAQVEEPPRSIMFVWDNSGSVSPYFNQIYGAINAFTQDVVPGREAVNYVVLGMNEPLLEAWSDDPLLLQRELTNYNQGDADSEAEGGLLVATNALAFRDGVKAIVLIADAEAGNGRTAELWRALNAVQPRIFTMHVHSTHEPGRNPADYQDRMMAWADVNAGYYDWFRTAAELNNGFERATTWLRRPKGYGISAELATIEPPGPGTLEVLSSAAGDDDQAAAELLGDTAVELIIDASGSMQQALEGSTRIDVAKTVLDDLVANVLPDGVPVALRAFGNREGNLSCRTDLEVPLAPLNREQLRATIAAIEPQTDANTALGASLALVAEDLAEATGPRLVILLTDGEETCEGDPLATIQQLRDSGVDVRVNIVGFAIDDEALKATFEEWAQVGGGQYFDAISADELTDSVADALRVPFRVLDGAGNEVAQGVVDGEPINLEAGVYTVELLTDSTQTYEVQVVGEEATQLGVQK